MFLRPENPAPVETELFSALVDKICCAPAPRISLRNQRNTLWLGEIGPGDRANRRAVHRAVKPAKSAGFYHWASAFSTSMMTSASQALPQGAVLRSGSPCIRFGVSIAIGDHSMASGLYRSASPRRLWVSEVLLHRLKSINIRRFTRYVRDRASGELHHLAQRARHPLAHIPRRKHRQSAPPRR